MPATEQKKGLRTKDIHFIIGTLIIYGFGYVCPPFGGIQPMGMKMLGVVIGLIYLTCVSCPILQSSLIALLAFPIHGYMDVSTLLTKWTGTTTTFQLVFAGAVMLGLKETGAMNVIAKKLLSAGFLKGKPALLMLMIMVVGFIISTNMGGAPYFLLFFGLIDSIADVAGYDRDDKFIKYALLGMYVAAYGMFLFPFKGAFAVTVAFFNSTLQPYGYAFNNNLYMLYDAATFIGFDIVYTLALKFIFKPDLAKLAKVDVATVETFREVPDHFDKHMKVAFWSAIVCIIYAIICGFGTKWPGFKVWGALTVTFIWVVPLILFSIVRVEGRPVFNIAKLTTDASLWTMIALVGSMTFLGTICTDQSENMGIRGAIESLFNPIFGDMSIPVLMAVLVVFVVVITQVVHGQVLVMGITAVIVPIIVSRLQAGDAASPTVILATVSQAAQVAFLFPSGSVNAAYVLNRPEMNKKFLFTSGVAVLCIFMVWQYVILMVFNILFSGK